MAFELSDDYVTVAERIVEFRNKYPDGTLQPLNLDRPYTIEIINGNPNFVVVAAAYRGPDDDRPGVGMAYEPIPGSTPYTRGSELQNAETAAWGRAIVATLAADSNRGIASKEEVMNQRVRSGARQANGVRGNAKPAPKPAVAPEVMADWQAAVEAAGNDYDALLGLHGQAARQGVHPDVLAMIKSAGMAAKGQTK